MYDDYNIRLEKVKVELGEDDAYNMYGKTKVLLNGELVAEADYILNESTGETCDFKNRTYLKENLREEIDNLFEFVKENIFIEFTGEELDSMVNSIENGNFKYEIDITNNEIYLG